ncbi:MAG TPA: glutamine synthetase family protein [Polyangiaceae bacterium]|jgi:glutamine synthetase|nr:glutamine synthetase family protein [Polyangiaceae bacterium]
MDAKELKEAFAKRGIRRVKVGGYDVDGILRGKYVSLDKFWGALEEPIGFCDVIFGWDAADVLYDRSSVTGWHTGYPDTHARIDPSTFRVLPWEPDTAAFLMDFLLADGTPHPACPRGLLQKVLARAKGMGFETFLAAEFEFFVFKETPASLHEKGFRKLEPLSPGMFGYSWVREGQNADLCHAILDDMERFGIPIEGLHTETGPGVYEAAIAYDEALRAADKAALFKTGMKQVATKLGYSLTFMAKWNQNLPGSSGHIHQSLWKDGKNVFHDASAPDKLSATARHYLGGQVALMPELTALISPTINSYKRYVPGVWAPLNASWGFENRTCAIRAIPGSAKSTRFENRQAAADINPYIAMAATVAAGLWGIEQRVEPPAHVEGDASARADLAPLPRTLRDACVLLDKSPRARDLLGAPFVDHYLVSRDWECRQYERAVTEWELERYFETV